MTAPHMARFLAMLDSAFRRFGVPEGLPARFRNAVGATPRAPLRPSFPPARRTGNALCG